MGRHVENGLYSLQDIFIGRQLSFIGVQRALPDLKTNKIIPWKTLWSHNIGSKDNSSLTYVT